MLSNGFKLIDIYIEHMLVMSLFCCYLGPKKKKKSRMRKSKEQTQPTLNMSVRNFLWEENITTEGGTPVDEKSPLERRQIPYSSDLIFKS